MFKIKVFAVIASLAFLVACGGSGDGGNADEQAEGSAETFFGILEFCGVSDVAAELAAGVSKDELSKALTDCGCPQGGTLDVNEGQDTIVLTATNCMSADGQNFDGTIIIDVAADTAVIDIDDFGDDCSTVEGTNLNFDEGSCAGTITATCDAGTATCTLVEPEFQGDGCDAECS